MHFARCSLISAAFAIAVATVVPDVAVGVAFAIGAGCRKGVGALG